MKRRLLPVILALALLFPGLSVSAAESSGFEDVSEGDWFREAVEYAASEGLFRGVTDTEFRPSGIMERGMFVTVLGRMARVDTSRYAASYFYDVLPRRYYSPYVQWAALYEITSGARKYYFSPHDPVTREQITAFLYRFAKATGNDAGFDLSVLDQFPDASEISSYAREPLAWAVSHGVIKGSGSEQTGIRLSPRGNATRSQVAQIFFNSRELFPKKAMTRDPIELDTPPPLPGATIYPDPPMTGDPIQDLLNHAPLTPVTTGSPADKSVGDVVKQITAGKANTYDKVKACYDWLIRNIRYGSNYGGQEYWDARHDFMDRLERPLYPADARYAFDAHWLIRKRVGVCDDYTAAFVVMTRMIGLESYKVGGTIEGEGHAWALIRINGKFYLFDPQVEDNISNREGRIMYWLFCKSEYPSGFHYVYEDRDRWIADFHGFRPSPG